VVERGRLLTSGLEWRCKLATLGAVEEDEGAMPITVLDGGDELGEDDDDSTGDDDDDDDE
jgi:hypothetical protein